MVESPDEPCRRPFAATPTQRRLVWFLLFVAWMTVALAVRHVLQTRAGPQFPRVELRAHGAYDAVEEVTGPVSIRLRGMGAIRLAGVSEPEEAAARDRAAAFLRNLLPSGADVYVEIEPHAHNGDATPALATVYLPPKDAARTGPFPYAEARLVARALVQEGLAGVDADRPYRYRAEFLLLQDDARRHGRGIWGVAGGCSAGLYARSRCIGIGGGAGQDAPGINPGATAKPQEIVPRQKSLPHRAEWLAVRFPLSYNQPKRIIRASVNNGRLP